jgi:hypothetical protein
MMAMLQQFPVVGVRFPGPVRPRGPESVFRAMGCVLRIARDLVLALWVIAALAFYLVVIASCVL